MSTFLGPGRPEDCVLVRRPAGTSRAGRGARTVRTAGRKRTLGARQTRPTRCVPLKAVVFLHPCPRKRRLRARPGHDSTSGTPAPANGASPTPDISAPPSLPTGTRAHSTMEERTYGTGMRLRSMDRGGDPDLNTIPRRTNPYWTAVSFRRKMVSQFELPSRSALLLLNRSEEDWGVACLPEEASG